MPRMYRTASMLLAVAILALSLSACAPTAPATAPTNAAPTASAPTAAPASAFPVTIIDDQKVEVTLKAEPQRIISLAPSHTETLFALGLGERVVGVTTFCDYPEEAKSKEKVGEFATVDLEKIVSLNPDLVLAASLHSQSVVPALRERGLNVLILEATNVPTTLDKIMTTGKATGRTQEAEALVKGIQDKLDGVAAKIATASQKPRVFWELDAMLYTAGKDSFIDGLITLGGGDNIGARLDSEWPQLNLEALIANDPEVIVLADHGTAGGESAEKVLARPGWGELKAVKNGKIIEVEDVNLISRPGPRVGEAVEYVARALHPELFE